MAIEDEKLLTKIKELSSKLCPAILTFIDDNESIFAMPIKDFTITKEHIDLKKPKSLHHKFSKDQKVGLCWCTYGINPKTGRMWGQTMEHYTLWGTANELGGDRIRVIPSPKYHSSFDQRFEDPAWNQEQVEKANAIRAKYGLRNAYETKGLV